MRAMECYNSEYCAAGGHLGGSLRAAATLFKSSVMAELFLAFPAGEERDEWIEEELNAVRAGW
jgi:hypothetical protein